MAVAGLLVAAWCGCGSPVVNPSPSPAPLMPPAMVPQPANPAGLPRLETPEIQQVPAESVLHLPSDSTSATYHSVKSGETLSSVARQYGVSVEKLRSANGLDSSAILKTQQLLFIPKDR
jgi:LysM repeat protein